MAEDDWLSGEDCKDEEENEDRAIKTECYSGIQTETGSAPKSGHI